MERAREALARLRAQRLSRRRIVADTLARAVQRRDRALAWGDPQLVARYEAVILRAEGALGVFDAALADD